MSVWAGTPIPRLATAAIFRAFRGALCAGIAVSLFAPLAFAQDPPDPETSTQIPPAQVPNDPQVEDIPDDGGNGIRITWLAPADAAEGAVMVLGRSESENGPFEVVDTLGLAAGRYVDRGVPRGTDFYYQMIALGPGGSSAPVVLGPVAATAQWFRMGRMSVAVSMMIFFALVLYFFWVARSGRELYVRRIPGIDAIEEAVGRATEMGRPVLYIPGIQDIDDIQTMASLIILESVSRMTAQYETRIIVPTNYPVVMTLAQEMVKNGHLQAGRPDAYDPDSVRYVTTEQFAYVAAINGIMLRDKPAANIFLGPFFAESLILAETGYQTKAIQVAGTANVHQLPFFVVACDYTLIGEELYAASAYLSKEPRLLSTLKGSDYMKVILAGALILGSVLESFGITGFTTWMSVQ